MKNINEQELFAFYGTLRQDQGNWAYFLKNQPGVEFLGTKVVPGFDMYSLGGYPMVAASENGTIVVDLFRVTNQKIKGGIDGMELGAGYSRTEITINDETYWIYTNNPNYYSKERLESFDRKVKSGDWVSFRTQPKTVNEYL